MASDYPFIIFKLFVQQPTVDNKDCIPTSVRPYPLKQTPDSYQLRSAHYSLADEPCSVANTKTVRSLSLKLQRWSSKYQAMIYSTPDKHANHYTTLWVFY